MSNISRSKVRVESMKLLYKWYLYKKNKINCSIDELIGDSVIKNNEFGKDIIYGVTSH